MIRIRRSASSRETARSRGCLRDFTHTERGSAPATYTRRPRSSNVTPSSESNVAGSSSRRNDRCENGSRLIARSWLPRIAKQFGRRATSRRRFASADTRVSRSPLTSVRSGARSSTHETARSTATRPRPGSPRWKSDRCATRSPASSGASPGSASGRASSRTQPASNQPQPRLPAARPPSAPAMGPARDSRSPAPDSAPPPVKTPPRRGSCSGFQLLEHRLDGDDVPLELQLRLLEPRGDPDELREVEDRHPEVPARRLPQLRLPRVEREVAERARRHHRVRAGLHRLLDRLDQLAERGLLACLDDREAAALDLGRIVDRLAAARGDDLLERVRPVGILEAHDLRGPQDLAAVERRHLQPLQSLVGDLLQQLEPLALRDQPEEVLDLDVAGVRRHAHRLEVAVDALAARLVALQLPIRLPEVERAVVAARHQRG